MSRHLRTLILGGGAEESAALIARLNQSGFATEWKQIGAISELSEALIAREWHIGFCALPFFESHRAAIQEGIRKRRSVLPLVVLAEQITEAQGIQAIEQGADDYLSTKAWDRLVPIVTRELQHRELRDEQDAALHDLQLLRRITLQMSEATDVHSALEVLLRELCQTARWEIGEAWVMNPKHGLLECSPKWYPATDAWKTFREASLQLTLDPHQRKPGLDFKDDRWLWLEDIAKHSEFPLGKAAIDTGLRSLLAIPVLLDRSLVAVIMLFDRTERQQSERFCRLLTILLGQLEPLVQRKQAEAALRKSAELFRRLSDCSPLGILLMDTQGNCIYSNPRCETILGVDDRESTGRGWLSRVHVEDRDVVAGQWDTSVKDQTELSCEFRVGLHDRNAWVHLRSASMTSEPEDSGAGYVVTVEDITGRKQLEAQFRQAQKMDTVGRLAGGIAHDFNNLLTAISSFARLAQDSLPEDSPACGDVEMILKASDRAANLTRQLLTFARREVAVPQILDLGSVLADLERMLRRLIREDIELVIEPAPKVRPIRMDPSQLEQVLFNLVVNARDAMPHGGKLRITVGEVQQPKESDTHLGPPSGDYVLLKVSDTGLGMSEEVQSHIFEPFFTTKSQGKGTGLGLATVYGIVRQNSGYIDVASKPALGTTFAIYFPPSEPETSETKPHTPARSGGAPGTETILVAEDEPEVRRLVERILRAKGYEVLLASNGDEALEVSRRQKDQAIHLLVSDMVMPKMGGKQLADRLRHERPDIRVLFMSGYTEELLGARTDDETEPTLIQKPFSPESLAAKVRELLDA